MAITVLARNFNLRWNASQRLDPVLTNTACVVTRSARNDVNIFDLIEHLGRFRTQRLRDNALVLDAPVERIRQCAWLIEYFFQHEMVVRRFLGRCAVPLRFMYFARDRITVGIHNSHAVTANLGEISLLQIDESFRNRQ